MFKNKEIRSEISKILRTHSLLFKEFDNQNEQKSIKLSDLDNLLKELNEITTTEKKVAKEKFSDELTLARLGVLLTGHVALALQEDDYFTIEDGLYPKPNFVLSNLVVQITNHSLGIINLIENGLENSARSLLRILD